MKQLLPLNFGKQKSVFLIKYTLDVKKLPIEVKCHNFKHKKDFLSVGYYQLYVDKFQGMILESRKLYVFILAT